MTVKYVNKTFSLNNIKNYYLFKNDLKFLFSFQLFSKSCRRSQMTTFNILYKNLCF